MTDDLVERLYEYRDRIFIEDCKAFGLPIFGEAAYRIEQLEAALRKIAQHDMQSIAMDALRPGERIRGKTDEQTQHLSW